MLAVFGSPYTVPDRLKPRLQQNPLYVLTTDGKAWKYKEGRFSCIYSGPVANKIEALGGIVYVLKNEGEIVRYSAQTDNLRALSEAGGDNTDLAAYYRDIFVMKRDGSV